MFINYFSAVSDMFSTFKFSPVLLSSAIEQLRYELVHCLC